MSEKIAKPSRLKAAVLNWLGFSFQDVEQWSALFGKESDTGIRVTAEKALTLSAVWACVRLISQTLSTLPLGLYERLPDGTRRLADNEAIARLINEKPNADMTSVVFWEALVASAMVYGNGFAEKRRIGGRIVAIEFLKQPQLAFRRRTNGSYEFTYTEDNGQLREIPEEDIFHLPGFTLDGKFGLSVIRYGAEVFGGALATNQAANSTFKNGLMPATYFKMDRLLNEDQRAQFRGNLAKITGALNAGKSPLLEGGMDVGMVGINPDDAQLLESREFSIEEVCRWFGVPPSMIGATDKASSWASSAESINLWFLQYGLRPWIKRIEQAIWDGLLTPAQQRRFYAEFSVEGLLRADTQARAEFYSTALQNGWMNRNQVAMMENLPPIPGGDVHTVQSNLIPLDQLGTLGGQGAGVDSAAVRAALKYWGKTDD